MNSQPKKAETLAKKAKKRSQRLILKSRFLEFSSRFWLGTGEILVLLLVLLFNFFLLWPFFGREDQTNIFSAPFIPILANVSSFFMPFDYAVRFWLLVFIIFFPLTFYLLIREISQQRLIAFLAVLVASLPLGIFLPLRINIGLLGEDGAQIASLTLTALACLFLFRFLRRGGFKMATATSFMIALTALTSPLGFFILFCFCWALTISEMLLSSARLKLARFVIVFLLATGLVSFWYNPKFAFLIYNSPQGQMVKKTLFSLFPLAFFLTPLLGVFGFLLFESRPRLQGLFVAVFWTIGFFLLFLGAGLKLSSPVRFLPSLGVSLSFLLAILLGYLSTYLKTLSYLKQFSFIGRFRRLIILVVLVVLAISFLLIVSKTRKDFVEKEQYLVLGLETVKRTGLWEIRKRSSGLVSDGIGFTLSLSTFGLLGLVRTKLKSNKSIKD